MRGMVLVNFFQGVGQFGVEVLGREILHPHSAGGE